MGLIKRGIREENGNPVWEITAKGKEARKEARQFVAR